MSWLSKALKNDGLKIATALVGARFAGEYLFTEGEFSDDNFFGSTLKSTGITPFRQTKMGQSFLGTTLDTLKPLATSLTGGRKREIPSPRMMNMGPQGTRFGANILQGESRQPQPLFPLGRGGQIMTAMNSRATQQYFAKQVRAMGLPKAAPLPSPNISLPAVSTTASQRRSYKKVAKA